MIDEKKLIKDIKEYHSKLNPKYISKLVDAEILDIIDIINEQPKVENTEDFKHFKLFSDSTLKSMTKDELIEYIHIIYHNWKACDYFYNKSIDENYRLSNQLVDTVRNSGGTI